MNSIRMSRQTLQKVGLILWSIVFLLTLLVFGVFVWFNLYGGQSRSDVKLGVTYSNRYAEALGLDPHATYEAILNDLGVRKIRLPVYWDQIETSPGKYDFSELDWQLEMAAERHAEVILVVGQRVPRWPECFIPEWAQQDDQVRRTALLGMIRTTVERYREHHPAVVLWQVENEAFLDQRFGICPSLDVNLLDTEIALVRSLDPSRKILMTDSGEISWWYDAASRGDIFGTTLYRDLWHPRFGYFSYPIGPNFFIAKEWFVRTFAHQDHIIVAELQAEPWARGWVGDVPLEEQFLTMNEHKLVTNVDYAKRLGTPEIYLWGAEWWYWLKEKKDHPAVWDAARTLFRESQNE